MKNIKNAKKKGMIIEYGVLPINEEIELDSNLLQDLERSKYPLPPIIKNAISRKYKIINKNGSINYI